MFKSRKKGAVEVDEIVKWGIAIIFAIVAVVGIFILKDFWISSFTQIRNFFRFGG